MNIDRTIAFQQSKLLKAIKSYGKFYVFQRSSENKFGESDGVSFIAIQIKCLFHETSNRSVWIQLIGSEAAKVPTKTSTMLLCSKEDFDRIPLKVGDIVIINNTKYKVIGLTNLWGADFAIDISIEAVV